MGRTREIVLNLNEFDFQRISSGNLGSPGASAARPVARALESVTGPVSLRGMEARIVHQPGTRPTRRRRNATQNHAAVNGILNDYAEKRFA